MKNLLLLFCLCSSVIYSQDLPSPNFINRVEQEINSLKLIRNQRLDSFFNKNTNAQRKIVSGDIKYVAYDVLDGKLLYRSNYNVEAAEATRTDFLKSGSSLNLNLQAAGMDIGLWEVGGSPLVSHVEFDNNGNSRIIISDGASNETTFHASHVAGTLAAAGVNPTAEGMAPASTVLSYDAVNDISEALNEATTNNLLISNHSYGIPVSSANGTAPASLMGTYNSQARAWDLTAEAAPLYLSVFSAGNDGGSTYSGGSLNGFDKLTGEKNSKNNLVVANASNIFLDNSGSGDFITAIINSSSSQGPSDDGRIKPDITGLGTQVFSTSNNGVQSYANSSGTSMSAPNVSGSLLLLQELYFDLHNQYMLSSTLKGIALITADDAGNIGPDAIFGWGILNSKKAAETILADHDSQEALINESVLNNNQQITFDVVSNGVDPLKVGVFWTDPAGFTQSATNSTVPALVNDLDIKVIDENGNEFFPWRLNLNNFAGSAQQGINSVDNNEIVEVQFATNSTYTVVIDHKNNLTNNLQNISIVATGITSHNLSVETRNETDFVVWPNPATDIIYLKSNTSIQNAEYSIIDVNGRLVKRNTISNTDSIDISDLSTGIYILRIATQNSTFTEKIVKE
jgi:hypothetical protein